MRGRIFWLGFLGCLACGKTDKSTMAPAGGVAGHATINGGAPTQSAGSGGVSGAVSVLAGSAGIAVGAGGDVGAAGDVAAGGDGGAGGEPPVPCVPQLTGNWIATGLAAAPSHPSNVDACWNLSLMRNDDGSLGLHQGAWFDYRATPLEFYLQFNPPAMSGDDGWYTLIALNRGVVVQDYAEACLADGVGKATCAELSELLTNDGIGEGSYPSITCVDAAKGGCSCSVQVRYTAGNEGHWSLDPDDPTRLTLAPLTSDGLSFTPFKVPYSVDCTALQFSDALAQPWPDIPARHFSKIDCTDGKQGPGEDGPDCGPLCETGCQ